MPEIIEQINKDFRSSMEKDKEEAKKAYETFSENIETAGYSLSQLNIKPYFIDEQRLNYIRTSVEIILRALQKMTNLYYSDPKIKELFELSEDEKKLVGLDASSHIQINRYDAFLGEDYLKFYNFSTDNPIGSMYTDTHGESFEKTPIFQNLQEKYALHRDPIMPHFLRTILLGSQNKETKTNNPCIIATGTKETLEHPEINSIISWLKTLGYDASFCELDKWEFDGETLATSDGLKPHVLYRCGTIDTWTANIDKIDPIMKAVEKNNVCMINSFSSILGRNKVILYLLQAPETQKYLDSEEMRVINETIPWTRLVKEETTTDKDNNSIELFSYIRDNKDSLVLRECSSNGKVTIGKEVTSEQWEEGIKQSAEKNTVVQTFFVLSEEEQPSFSPELAFSSKRANLSFYLYEELYGGAAAKMEAQGDSCSGITSLFCVSDSKNDAVTVKITR